MRRGKEGGKGAFSQLMDRKEVEEEIRKEGAF